MAWIWNRRQTLQWLPRALLAGFASSLTHCGPRRSRPMTIVWDAATSSSPPPEDFVALYFPKVLPNKILRPIAGGPPQTLDRALLCALDEGLAGRDITVYLADSSECLASPSELQREPDPATLADRIAGLNRVLKAWGKETAFKSAAFEYAKNPSGTWRAVLLLRSEKYQQRFEYDIRSGTAIPLRMARKSTVLDF